MKPGSSSLNPYAAAYVPLSERGKNDQSGGPNVMVKDAECDKQISLCEHLGKVSLDHKDHGNEKLSASEAFPLKSQPFDDFYGLSVQASNVMVGGQMMDEEVDMELEYLQMTFPGISGQFLFDAYFLNNGDLEATIDMLNHLESSTSEPCGNLPDTLDIGDVPESSSPAKHSSLKLDNVSGEASTSASGPSDPAVPA